MEIVAYLGILGFPGSSEGKDSAYNAGALGWEDSCRMKWQPTPVFLPGESHGQRRLVVYSQWGRKSQT